MLLRDEHLPTFQTSLWDETETLQAKWKRPLFSVQYFGDFISMWFTYIDQFRPQTCNETCFWEHNRLSGTQKVSFFFYPWTIMMKVFVVVLFYFCFVGVFCCLFFWQHWNFLMSWRDRWLAVTQSQWFFLIRCFIPVKNKERRSRSEQSEHRKKKWERTPRVERTFRKEYPHVALPSDLFNRSHGRNWLEAEASLLGLATFKLMLPRVGKMPMCQLHVCSLCPQRSVIRSREWLLWVPPHCPRDANSSHRTPCHHAFPEQTYFKMVLAF